MGKITVRHYLNTKLKPEVCNDNYICFPIYLTITVNSKNIKRKSHITEFVSAKELENDFVDMPQIKTHLDYEADLITRIIRLYISDIDNRAIKNNLVSFFDLKGYNSKDNFINLLNAYIDFYSHSIYEAVYNQCSSKIENEVFERLKTVFNFADKTEAQRFFSYQNPIEEADFIYKNLSRESIEYLVLRERLKSFLATYANKTGYDIPLIDWKENLIQGELKAFLETYRRKSEYYIKDGFSIDKALIEKYISIIDNIVNADDYIQIAKSRRTTDF
ncbi:hypothetical protein [Paludibacter jiangxiensis]|uniref:Uncharacterized protein n=1 Tax=Paludibacter jiangxiensis TaxID=681398 RepID=A0A161LTL8_9BACT|nr:hypothetical protein [Paludibacter jiangxiensis]GAT64350.1 hypothetical protein PJIAN_4901 [Paludibacter jiangxiensis]